MKCEHLQFVCEGMVNRLEDTGRFQLDIRVRCEQCNTPFRFIGLPYGLDLNGAAVSVDGQEGRFAIAPSGQVLTLVDDKGVGGFTIRKETA